MSDPKRYLITSALPYTNGPVHIGQVSGAYLPADIYTRLLRKKYGKENVLYVCGSDEHGVPITIRAKQEGVTPQDIVDKYNAIIKKSFKEFGISFDIYHRTSDSLHHETAQEFFLDLYDKGILIEKESEQWFDPEANQFLADRYITGTCPNCANENAYGDQCEKCGSSLSPNELLHPKSALSGAQPIKKRTKHWYLPLDKMQEDWLQEWLLGDHNEPWKKHVLGQCKSWLDNGLLPRAVTRDLDWGVSLPIPDGKDKVLYVWFDAPIGYISATKAWAQETGNDWKPWWQDESSKLVHFIGKDNIVFHCIIFPAMLKAKGNYILPTNVPANQFMNMEGQKMSTSKNWTVWLNEYLEDFPDQQDKMRYVLLMNMPENKDSDFSWKDFQEKVNNELVSNIGNFVNRAMVLTQKYFAGKVPMAHYTDEDKSVLQDLKDIYAKVEQHIEAYEMKQAMQYVLQLSTIGNRYLAEQEPWKKIKTDEERTGTTLNVATQVVAHLSRLLSPVLPFTATKISKILNIEESEHWLVEEIIMKEGHQMNPPELLFSRVEDEEIAQQMEKLELAKVAAIPVQTETVKSDISFDHFMATDLRIVTIVAAEKVPKTKKLMKLQVDLGSEKRTVVSGIAEFFKAEEIIGKKVLYLANLPEKTLRGIASQGMILMAENTDGSLFFVATDAKINAGSVVR